MWAHDELSEVLAEHVQWQEVGATERCPAAARLPAPGLRCRGLSAASATYARARPRHAHPRRRRRRRPQAQRLVRHMEAHARYDANLEMAWLSAEQAESKAREAAGAAPVDADAARRARRKNSRPLVGWPAHATAGGRAAAFGSQPPPPAASPRLQTPSSPPAPRAPHPPIPQRQMHAMGEDMYDDGSRAAAMARDRKKRKVGGAGRGGRRPGRAARAGEAPACRVLGALS
jgi:hypothetical protein